MPHTKYLNMAQDIVAWFKRDDISVLKLDCNNELESSPCAGGIANNLGVSNITLLEFNEDQITQFKSNKTLSHIPIYQGDIRCMPFESEIYDLILDCSTLDHIPMSDVSAALSEYARVLKPGGLVLLMVWVHTDQHWIDSKHSRITEHNHMTQYYFNAKDIDIALREYFDVEYFEADFMQFVGNYLVFYGLVRKD